MPVEPPPCPWLFPDFTEPVQEGEFPDDLVARGADLEPGTLLAAYRAGVFPMPLGDETGVATWWAPRDRGVLPLASLRVSRSLARSRRRMEIRFDTAFEHVVRACAEPTRDGGWIDDDITVAYTELHRLGWAHSVEAWSDGELVGGLYGVAIGGLFAGESMFHRVRDASKVALVGLVELLCDEYADARLIDVQWRTPHLASLGVVEWPRPHYARQLRAALQVPLPERWR
jgi:leucyl/phenylalanyl-tRNA--protein transferase